MFWGLLAPDFVGCITVSTEDPCSRWEREIGSGNGGDMIIRKCVGTKQEAFVNSETCKPLTTYGYCIVVLIHDTSFAQVPESAQH